MQAIGDAASPPLALRAWRLLIGAAALLLGPALAAPAPASGLFPAPVGTAVYWINGEEEQLLRIFADNDNDPEISSASGSHTAIGVAAWGDDIVVCYDHWEDGYDANIADPSSCDELYMLDEGDDLILEAADIPLPRTGALSCASSRCFYDGRDRILATGGPITVTRAFWPESTGPVYADAWEVYPSTALDTSYVVPMGQDLGGDFGNTYVVVQAMEDGTLVQIDDPTTVVSPDVSAFLEAGEVTELYHAHAGTTVSGSNPVQVQVLAGNPWSGLSSEMRMFSLLPRESWATSYYNPVADLRDGNRATAGCNSPVRSEIYVYNAEPSAITIDWEDRSGSGSFTVPSNGIRRYSDGTGHYVPVQSAAYVSSSARFYAFGAADTNCADFDWGWTLVPSHLLSSEYYVAWAPGSTDSTRNCSPLWVTPAQNATTVTIDYDGDGVPEQTQVLDRLAVGRFRDVGDNDNSGAIVRASGPVAVAWGADGDQTASNPCIDAGYTILPIAALVGGIGDRVWNDVDGDGIQDPGEPGIVGVQVCLTSVDGIDIGGSPSAESVCDVTDANGRYLFQGLPPGRFQVAVTPATIPPGWANTGDPDDDFDGQSTLLLASSISVLDRDFGYQAPPTPTSPPPSPTPSPVAIDFGDAPDPSYSSLEENDGARHRLGSSVYLGACVDGEADAVQASSAMGDDTSVTYPVAGVCSIHGDDDDGVVFGSALVRGGSVALTVTANATCNLSAWFDWNSDGDWDDFGEQVFSDEQLAPGANSLLVPIPPATTTGTTYARFRCSTDTGLSPKGFATDGEVEDYRLMIAAPTPTPTGTATDTPTATATPTPEAVDFGDAPDPSYPSRADNRGAQHRLGNGVYLGNCVDGEPEALQGSSAMGDDTSVTVPVLGDCAVAGDDDDGVVFGGQLVHGASVALSVSASAACNLSVWVDWNVDGDWLDPGERVIADAALVTGTNALTMTIPVGAASGITYARFRCSTGTGLEPTGFAVDGEVEDYRLLLLAPSPTQTHTQAVVPTPTPTPTSTSSPTSTATATATSERSGCLVDPLDVATSYNVFLLGNADLAGSDVEGNLAVGGNAVLQGYSIGITNVGPADALVVSGDLTFAAGTVYGDLYHGGTLSLGANVDVAGTIHAGTPIDFTAAGIVLSDLCADLSTLVPATTVSGGPVVTLTGADPQFNAFRMSAVTLDAAKNLVFAVPSSSSVLVIIDGSPVAMANMGFQTNGLPAARILYAACDATALTIHGAGPMGTILAPDADVTFNAGLVTGQIIANSMSGNGQTDLALFEGCLK